MAEPDKDRRPSCLSLPESEPAFFTPRSTIFIPGGMPEMAETEPRFGAIVVPASSAHSGEENEKGPSAVTTVQYPERVLNLNRSHDDLPPATPLSIASTTYEAEHGPVDSPFHPAATSQTAAATAEPPRKLNIVAVQRMYAHFDDLENGSRLTHSRSASSPKISFEGKKACTMWPSQEELKRQYKEHQRSQQSSLRRKLPRLSRKARLLLTGGIFLVIVGVALVIGLVVSKKVNGGYYKSPSQPSKPIGKDR